MATDDCGAELRGRPVGEGSGSMTVRTGWSAMDAVALLARFALAAVWIASGVLKMQNPGATLLSVRGKVHRPGFAAA